MILFFSLFSLTTAQLVPASLAPIPTPKAFSCSKVTDDCLTFAANPCRSAPPCRVTGAICCATSCTAFDWFSVTGNRIAECKPLVPTTTSALRATLAPTPACDTSKCPTKDDVFAQCANKPDWEVIYPEKTGCCFECRAKPRLNCANAGCPAKDEVQRVCDTQNAELVSPDFISSCCFSCRPKKLVCDDKCAFTKDEVVAQCANKLDSEVLSPDNVSRCCYECKPKQRLVCTGLLCPPVDSTQCLAQPGFVFIKADGITSCCSQCKKKPIDCANANCATAKDDVFKECANKDGFELLTPDETRCCYECKPKQMPCGTCASAETVTRNCEKTFGANKFTTFSDQCGCTQCKASSTVNCAAVRCAAPKDAVEADCRSTMGRVELGADGCCFTCVPGSTNPCEQVFDAGIGRAAFPVFAFNPRTRQCEKRIFGGVAVRGNTNRFFTLDECQAKCSPPSPTSAGSVDEDTARNSAAALAAFSPLVVVWFRLAM
jgi:hypothetical protein